MPIGKQNDTLYKIIKFKIRSEAVYNSMCLTCTASYQSVSALNSNCFYLCDLEKESIMVGEGTTSKAGSWLTTQSPQRSGNGLRIQRLISHPQWWILSILLKVYSLTKGFTSNQKKVTKERCMFKYIILSGRFYIQSVTFWPKSL